MKAKKHASEGSALAFKHQPDVTKSKTGVSASPLPRLMFYNILTKRKRNGFILDNSTLCICIHILLGTTTCNMPITCTCLIVMETQEVDIAHGGYSSGPYEILQFTFSSLFHITTASIVCGWTDTCSS